uniref:Peptidase metallopeptidase domain-containing protein n=1 Tax=Panagrolaimus sp. PS1159 TaxID=55785 RepID=A0AC35FJK7_9BILA
MNGKPIKWHTIQKRYVLHPSRWPDCDLTWAFRDPFKLFTNDEDYWMARNVIEKVIQTWENSAGGALTFTDLSPKNRNSTKNSFRQAKIDVIFARYDHNDLESFDGPGGMVAHSGYPSNGIVHFDASENWTISDKSDPDVYVDLRYVALHEIGHALGLHHSASHSSIMNPFYSNYTKPFKYKLSKDDIYGIQELYQNCIQ